VSRSGSTSPPCWDSMKNPGPGWGPVIADVARRLVDD
jgi:hypothetical protein